MAIVLQGTVVTFDSDHRILDPGAVYVGDDGRLAAVRPAAQDAPAGFSAAPRIDTGALILPGLVDLHNHLTYNTLPLWEAAGVPYAHHDRWVDEDHPPGYSTSVTWPAKVLAQAAPEALVKYVEVKALIGGTTSIQGAPASTRAVDGWLLRIIDNEKLPAGADMVMTSALQLDAEELREIRAPKLDGTRVLIYHVAEGKPGSIVHREFDELEPCLKPGLVGVHGTALTAADFTKWHDAVTAINAAEKGTVVWSPFSNYWLYHDTTDVAEADKKGLRIALGSDWSPSGTKHVLGELKVADAVNRHELDGHFSDRDLCDMVTANPGDALATAWGPQVGRLQRGSAADLLVLERHNPAEGAYRNLIEATERHVRLVMVRGRPFYGAPALMTAAGATQTDTITVAGLKRHVAVRRPDRADAKLDWPGIKRALEKVRKDPVAAWRASQDALAAWGGPLDEPEAPLALFGDMPDGDVGAFAAAGEIPPDLVIPPLDALTHEEAYFDAVARSGVPELQHLAEYYS
ncbi:amidohydrolase family protein [Streptomyces roseoverticillatus]|uniref:amidohydrolase family protein n=1 Tax=Streptomyces roseoverticillatus TaxID=66429 RepID=UPI0004C02719|nr:amidohydrolase family protein [Streptomyces roseoverticillatus]